ncbi:uncharacterized protein LOC134530713 isoform X2 [Bacillus rossius redtenbacheri]|uniref:uncharacterized protein LOC134530713 isoform X2 n=1 Tax=Bacillus rossius redtenbacheri TaxID=93214 RepID=UPI002FDDDABE
MGWTLVAAACLVLLGSRGGLAVRINNLLVPPTVRTNSDKPVILDCDYTLKQGEDGLVVKWFFNNTPAPVYQWIPGQRPQELGILKGRLNLNYEASDNHVTKHRALYIVNPTTDLTGEYKCFVSTFNDEDFMTKKMVVFAEGRNFEFSQQRKPDEDSMNISCRAEALYPEPKMVLYKDTGSKDKKAVEGALVHTWLRDGLFGINATKALRDDELQSPTMFDCELHIPDANYVVKKSLVYYPGLDQPTSDSGFAYHPLERLAHCWLSFACFACRWRASC